MGASQSNKYETAMNHYHHRNYKEAIESFLLAGDHIESLFMLGIIHNEILNFPQALEYFIKTGKKIIDEKKNQEHKDILVKTNNIVHRMFYEKKIKGNENIVKIFEYYQTLHTHGERDYDYDLGLMLIEGNIVERDIKLGIKYLYDAHIQGNPKSMEVFKSFVTKKRNYFDAVELVKFLMNLVEEYDFMAACAMAELLETYRKTPPVYQTGRSYLNMMAHLMYSQKEDVLMVLEEGYEKYDLKAILFLGRLVMFSDFEKSEDCFNYLLEQEDPEMIYQVAIATEFPKCLEYLEKSHLMGNDKATLKLGKIYMAHDEAKGISYLKKYTIEGSERNEALFILGEHFVKKDVCVGLDFLENIRVKIYSPQEH